LCGKNYLSAQRRLILKPDPAFAAEVAEQSSLLDRGEDEELKQIVLRMMEGDTSEDHPGSPSRVRIAHDAFA